MLSIYHIEGLKGDDCVKRITALLLRIKGVDHAHVNLVQQRMKVIYDTNKVNPLLVEEEIQKLGYEIDEITY